ncbi:ArnT family glycosyltransferase [Psychromicrobium xiongbiense]|uniref:ArnT family glycosyltransferase n=1 Tax=Psychromicrobium xiongbiense TaxID=3051184 RepID=UPI0025571A82|nr:glycosyltransferase family 39 protein [Psychromicrobium sp. YIM S02556]
MNASATPAVWYRRSFRNQPLWHWLVLAGIILLAVVLESWNLGQAGMSEYYGTAARSMSESWRAFFFGSYDPDATITLDKLSGFLVPQALSARIFGFNQVSITLPQVIEGAVTVWAGYRIGKNWAGPLAGLLAAAGCALTPLAISMFGHSMEDGMLIMFCVLAVMSWQDAVRTGKLRWLVLSGVWVGLGFQAKMMEAWFVIPALVLGYLLVVHRSWWFKIRHVLIFGAVTLVVSLSWMTAIQLVPAQDRPYVDGSTNNNMYAMVFGYNGLNRFIPEAVSGSVTTGPGLAQSGRSGGMQPGTAPADGGQQAGTQGGGTRGVRAGQQPGGAGGFPGGSSGGSAWKLLSAQYISQIGWLYPAALFGLLLSGMAVFRRRASQGISSAFWVGGIWLATGVVILSAMTIPHTAYLAILAMPIAGLSAVGGVLMARAYRKAQTLRQALLPAGALAIQTAWSAVVASTSGLLTPWLPLVIAMAGAAGVLALTLPWLRQLPSLNHQEAPAAERRGFVPGQLLTASTALAIAAVFLGPAAWSASVVVPAYAGTASDAYAGPRQTEGGFSGGFGGAGMGGFGGADGAGTTAGQGQRSAPGAGIPQAAGGRGERGGNPAADGAAGNRGGDQAGAGSQGAGAQGGAAAGGPFAAVTGTTLTLDAADQKLYDYLHAQNPGAHVLMATDSRTTASRFILNTGQEVISYGGFSGTVPSLTLDQFTALVTSGQLKYVLLTQPAGSTSDTASSGRAVGGMMGRVASTPEASTIRDWVAQHFTVVPASDYGSGSGTSSLGTLYVYQG